MVERRKWRRFEIEYPLEGVSPRAGGTFNLNDVSRGGIAFTAGRDLCEGDRIDLRIFLKHKMFKMKALVVYAKEADKNTCNIGAKFLNAQDEFYSILEKEIEDIKQLYRESSLYAHKQFSFKQISTEYLKDNTTHE